MSPSAARGDGGDDHLGGSIARQFIFSAPGLGYVQIFVQQSAAAWHAAPRGRQRGGCPHFALGHATLLTSPATHVQQSVDVMAGGPLQPPTQHSWPTVQLVGQIRCPPVVVEATVVEERVPPAPSFSSSGVLAPHAVRQTATHAESTAGARQEIIAGEDNAEPIRAERDGYSKAKSFTTAMCCMFGAPLSSMSAGAISVSGW